MKKILAILALMIMVTILASCGENKEGSKVEEGKEWAKVESAEKATSKVEVPIAIPVTIPTKKITKSVDLKTTWSWSKSEDQVVKDFENELDGLFKLLESNPNAKK